MTKYSYSVFSGLQRKSKNLSPFLCFFLFLPPFLIFTHNHTQTHTTTLTHTHKRTDHLPIHSSIYTIDIFSLSFLWISFFFFRNWIRGKDVQGHLVSRLNATWKYWKDQLTCTGNPRNHNLNQMAVFRRELIFLDQERKCLKIALIYCTSVRNILRYDKIWLWSSLSVFYLIPFKVAGIYALILCINYQHTYSTSNICKHK